MDNLKTLILVGITFFVLWKLWSVLGETTGHEVPPKLPSGTKRSSDSNISSSEDDKYQPQGLSDFSDSATHRWAEFAQAGSEQEEGLNAIVQIEKNFDAFQFQEGAKAAYEMVVEAFSSGNRQVLKNLLANDVYNNFDQALKEREQNGETVETTFVSIEKADFSKVSVHDRKAYITLSFLSKMITVSRDKQGNVIDGDPSAVVDVSDVWTFSRALGNRNPNWTLVATEEGV